MRAFALGRRTYALAVASVGLAVQSLAADESAATVTRSDTGGAAWFEPTPVTPLPFAELSADRSTAIPPATAPERVRRAINAANRIVGRPYRYGGGHRRFKDRGYDCSGSVSYALHGAGLLRRPLASGRLMRWGRRGRGQWITVYANRGHAYVVIAGLRFDTSGRGGRGPRWRTEARSSRTYVARHPAGL